MLLLTMTDSMFLITFSWSEADLFLTGFNDLNKQTVLIFERI